MNPVTLEFPPPGKLLSMNDRGHWRRHNDLKRAWRTAASDAVLEARQRRRIRWSPPLAPSIVAVTLPVPDRRRRDPHNYFATVKPIVDGLVDGGLWPDDTPEWVTTIEPALEPGAALVVVTISPRDAR